MLKKTVKFTDLNGNPTSEDLYFNLSKAELIELEIESDVPMSRVLKDIGENMEPKRVLKAFKDFVLLAYGVKSEDGRRFIKNDKVRQEFMESEAYSELLWQMFSDANFAAEFIKGLMPGDLLEAALRENPSLKKTLESTENPLDTPVSETVLDDQPHAPVEENASNTPSEDTDRRIFVGPEGSLEINKENADISSNTREVDPSEIIKTLSPEQLHQIALTLGSSDASKLQQ